MEDERVKVLVTGCGEWQSYSERNPSFLVAQSLPPSLPADATTPAVGITVHPTAVPVSYSGVDTLIPTLFDPPAPRYDFVVHMGVAPSQDTYELETVARRDGYKARDKDGQLPEGGSHPGLNGQLGAPRLCATADTGDDADVRLSTNAGLYLCEYIFYSSSAYFAHHRNERLPWNKRTVVSFMHVPGPNDPATVAKGRDVLIALIRALVESRLALKDRV